MNTQRAFGRPLLAIVCAIGLCAGAYASDQNYDVPRQVVKYVDLNLNSLAGVSTLYSRIRQAAIRVCGDPAATRELSRSTRLKTCNEQAVERAVNAVNSSALTSVHLQKAHPTAKLIVVAEALPQ
jgi:UrcA family protein